MPPRHTYWTIIFGNQPTSFRAATREELLPTFRQIQGKHPDAVMRWFANGRLWRSEEEAGAARFPGRGPGGGGDDRRRGPFDRPRNDRPPGAAKPRFDGGGKPAWRDRPPVAPKSRSDEGGKPEWKDRARGPRPEWKDRPRDDRRPDWKNRPPAAPKSRRDEGGKPQWKDRPPAAPKPHSDEGAPPSGGAPPKSKDRWRNTPGGGERRGRDWRPGGEHKDPRDRFKVPRDVKRARFKDKLRRDHSNPKPGTPRGGDRDGGPPKKKDDE